MRTLIDEYGDTGILQSNTPAERCPYCGERRPNRRNVRGERLGPAPQDRRSYDERQIGRRPETLCDIAGRLIDCD